MSGNLSKLLHWQKSLLQNIFRTETKNQPEITSGAITTARGSGKTTFAAMIACSAVIGPLSKPMGEVAVVASSYQQAFLSSQPHKRLSSTIHR